MFEFFIALFGGLFYGSVKVSDKEASKKHKRFMGSVAEWGQLLNDEREFDNIIQQLVDKETRWILLDSIANNLEYIYGKNWREQFEYSEPLFGSGKHRWSIWEQAAQILLAKQGKLVRYRNDGGMQFGVALDFMNDNERIVVLKVFQVIEQYIRLSIRKNHPNYPTPSLCYVPNRTFKMLENGKTEVNLNGCIACGKLRWSFEINQDCKTHTPISTLL